MKYISSILNILLGAVFIFSGISKLFPIELFEYDLVDYGIINWALSPYLSRLIISFEIFLGMSLIVNWNFRRTIFPLSILILLFFTSFLLLRIVVSGNDNNCGCFGTWLPMSNVQSILKNILLIALLFTSYKVSKQNLSFKRNKLFVSISLIIITSGIFAFRIPEDFYLSEPKAKLEKNTINPEIFPPIISGNDSIKPNQSKQFLAFFSLTCQHCIHTARKLTIIQKNNPYWQILAYLNGNKADLETFKEKSKFNLNYTLFNKRDFVLITLGGVPKVYLTNKLEIKEYWTGEDFTEKELELAWKKY
jgi:hypothetical protein